MREQVRLTHLPLAFRDTSLLQSFHLEDCSSRFAIILLLRLLEAIIDHLQIEPLHFISSNNCGFLNYSRLWEVRVDVHALHL